MAPPHEYLLARNVQQSSNRELEHDGRVQSSLCIDAEDLGCSEEIY